MTTRNAVDLFDWNAMEKTTLNDICQNRHGGNPHSVSAHQKASKGAEALRKRILGHLRAPAGQRGLTCDECEYLTGLSHQSVSARFSELKRDGKIIKIGVRNTRSGSPAAVYKIV